MASKCSKCLRSNFYIISIIFMAVAGYITGLCLQSYNLSTHTKYLIGYPGQLVLRAFFMIIVPLLFCSLVLAIARLRKGGDARMVAITLAFFLGLSSLSATMGAAAGHVVHPGQKITGTTEYSQSNVSGRKGVILDSMLDLVWNSIPNNIIQATFMKEYTHVEALNVSEIDPGGNTTQFTVVYQKSIQQKNGVNFMGLLMFSILFGSALASLGDKGEQLYQVIDQLNSVIMKIMKYFLNLLPIGMFFWLFREGLETTAGFHLLGYLGVFLATAFGCIAFHQLILLPGLYLIIVRKNPFRFHMNMLPAILTAFGTCSSAATLPATVRCAEEINGLNRCVTRFVLPLGMAVHMNGGTFYFTLATVFLAQLEGIQLGVSETVIAGFTALLLFISAPGTVGGGSPVYLLTIMAAAGIDKPQYISLILPTEWLMERFRTVMNVVADSYVAAFVEKLSAANLPVDDSGGGGNNLEMTDGRTGRPICAYAEPPFSDPYRKGCSRSMDMA